MRHIEEITVTIKGLAPKPERYVVPKHLGRKLLAMLEAEQEKSDSIPAEVVFPVLNDDVQRPATCLRGLRYRQEMTQKQLADKIGIRQHHLSEMENGKRPIGKAMAKKLAEALNGNWQTLM